MTADKQPSFRPFDPAAFLPPNRPPNPAPEDDDDVPIVNGGEDEAEELADVTAPAAEFELDGVIVVDPTTDGMFPGSDETAGPSFPPASVFLDSGGGGDAGAPETEEEDEETLEDVEFEALEVVIEVEPGVAEPELDAAAEACCCFLSLSLGIL
jgi:hypothetical protein